VFNELLLQASANFARETRDRFHNNRLRYTISKIKSVLNIPVTETLFDVE